MIKAGGMGKDGKPVVILGLSEGNLGELRKGHPIVIELAPFGLEGRVLLMWGETEQAITQELAKHFTLPA
jgi:hypothetical protein